MALAISGRTGTGGGNVDYELHAYQTGSSGHSRTIKLLLKLRVNHTGSWYAYPAKWYARVNGHTSGGMQLKGTESWSSSSTWREFSFSYTTNVGTAASKSIQVGFTLESLSGSSLWNTTKYGNFTVGATNTAPRWPSGAYLRTRVGNSSGTIISSSADDVSSPPIIWEDVENIYTEWSAATDTEGGTLTYHLYYQSSNSSWVRVATTTNRYFTHKIGMTAGTSHDYYVVAVDSSGAVSGNLNTRQFQKNTFTADTVSGPSYINSTTSSVALTFAGAKNSNGVTSGIFRTVSCLGVAVHNNSVSKSPVTVKIHKTGTPPTGPYVNYSDVVRQLSGSSHKGALSFYINAGNGHGGSVSGRWSVEANLQSNPTPPSSVTVSSSSVESPICKTHAVTKNVYYMPDGINKVKVNWTAGKTSLGEGYTYVLYYKIGTSGEWVRVGSTNALTMNCVLPRMSNNTVTFNVKINTVYGKTSNRSSSAINMHYYSAPGCTILGVTRSATSAIVRYKVKSVTSVPNVNAVGTWSVPGKGSGSLPPQQDERTFTVNGLIEANGYSGVITYKDDTGWCSNNTMTFSIPANKPIFKITKYGICSHGAEATVDTPVIFGASATITGPTARLNLQSTGSLSAINFESYSKDGILLSHTSLDDPDLGQYGLWLGNNEDNPNTGLKPYLLVDGKVVGESFHSRDKKFYLKNGYLKNVDSGAYVGLPMNGKIELVTNTSEVTLTGAGITINPTDSDDPYINFVNSYSNQDVKITSNAADGTRAPYGIRIVNGTNSSSSSKPYLEVAGKIYSEGYEVVASGGNSNGDYVRFSNGVQICWRRTTSTSISPNIKYGSVYITTTTWTYPIAFSNTPAVTASYRYGTAANWASAQTISTTNVVLYVFDAFTRSTGTTSTVSTIAIGKWK